MSYIYRHVKVDRVIDGDTVTLSVDMGNKVTWTDNFRLSGIDTPERGQPGHADAGTFLTQLLKDGISRIETFKPDKFGRWLVEIYVLISGGELLVNQELINKGFAKPYFGGSK